MRQIRLIGWSICALLAIGTAGCSTLSLLEPAATPPTATVVEIVPQRDGLTVNSIVEHDSQHDDAGEGDAGVDDAGEDAGSTAVRAVVEIAGAGDVDAGIGAVEGTIRGMRPTALIFRIHVHALEGAGFAYGETRLTAGAGPDGYVVSAQTGGADPVPLDPADPNWLAIAAFHADGRPARQTPIADGYFEIAAPAAFLNGDDATFHLQWVDFYR